MRYTKFLFLFIIGYIMILCVSNIYIPKAMIDLSSWPIKRIDGYDIVRAKYKSAAKPSSVCEYHTFQIAMFPSKYCVAGISHMRNSEGERVVSEADKPLLGTWAEPLEESVPERMATAILGKNVYGYYKPDGSFVECEH